MSTREKVIMENRDSFNDHTELVALTRTIEDSDSSAGRVRKEAVSLPSDLVFQTKVERAKGLSMWAPLLRGGVVDTPNEVVGPVAVILVLSSFECGFAVFTAFKNEVPD